MRKNLRRFMSKQSSSAATPAGFNPFAYQVDHINSHFFSQFSGFTKGLLIFLFICHLVIAIFCSIILVLPYFQGTKRSQWIFRKLYIKTHPGANVYKTPLFWINAGVLMTISQLISSVATQAYIIIWFKIANAGKPTHTLTEPTLGLMFMCEMLTYWGLMHCFVVAIYYDHETQVENIAKEDKRWTPSPTFINVLFLGFPMVIVIATVTLFSIMSVFHAQLVNLIEELLNALRQGSSDWDQLRVPSTSVDEKYLLVTQLAEVVSEAKIFGDQILIRVGRSIHFIHILLSIILALICITFLCFIGVFSILIRKFQQQNGLSGHESSESSSPFRRWFKPKGWRSTSEEKSRSNRRLINRQFFHLLIRAVFIIIAMLTSVTLFSLWVTRTGDFIMSYVLPHNIF
ncbi:hypothetical protein PGTUg99_035025 [Puccinia graminis f. sp. tritici]|uniref:Uncharacterized protein n=1 Tax=Puccinia graminis f. sp. tritici TaxID=56615 RepID=A0A5B0QTP4_PUCGR|nr:hypothetical protein PGTUg99_035025 [Puccinia graminis f. sp. tritici]